MAAEVYLANLKSKGENDSKVAKIQRLFNAAKFGDFIDKDDFTAIKVHFGEPGNDGFVSPIFIRPVVAKIKEKGGKPFVTDCNTIYKGRRSNSIDHIITATENGFSYSVIGAPIIIGDGIKSRNIAEVEINKKHFKSVKIGRDIHDADNMIVVSHFKGHMMAGFGGAIKNLGMGCACAEGKKEQHNIKFVVNDNCVGCGQCTEVCPATATTIPESKAVIDNTKCIGCGECMSVCQVNAIGMDWNSEIIPFTEKICEYAYGAIKNKKNKVGYINFLINITPDCDCLPWTDRPIVPDIGILASTDPVAIDRACYDLVNKQAGLENSALKTNHEPGKDKFKGVKSYTESYIQISYGEEIGLGDSNYNLIEI